MCKKNKGRSFLVPPPGVSVLCKSEMDPCFRKLPDMEMATGGVKANHLEGAALPCEESSVIYALN